MKTAEDTSKTSHRLIVGRLQALAEPLDRAGSVVRWQEAIRRATQTDPQNPAIAGIMDLALLCLEDARDPSARVDKAEISVQGKTVARFTFSIIQLCLLVKVALTWGPDGPVDREDVSGEDMRDAMLSVYRRYHQESIFAMTVDEYETRLKSDGMFPEKATELSHCVVSVLAGGNATGEPINPRRTLDQYLTEGPHR